MTTEEKAKAYDEALERAKKWYNAPNIDKMPTYGNRIIEEIFPELIEENEDEKIRKELIKFVKVNIPNEERYIAWLEKQNPIMAKSPQLGKQKPANNNELKFKVGDWVVENGVNGNPVQITSFEEDKGVGIKVWFSNGTGTWVDYLKGYHKWTIEDARDGDVLADNLGVILFKSIRDNNVINYYAYLSGIFSVQKDEEYWGYAVNCTLSPATKDQRERFFAAMHDAGYEFDFEKKKLKKIENETEIPFGAKDSELHEVSYYIPEGFYAEIDDDGVIIKKGKKPSAWCKEDDEMFDGVIADIRFTQKAHNNGINQIFYEKEIDWLKSIKQRMKDKL